MSESWTLEGLSDGRPGTLVVEPGAVELRPAAGEPRRVPLEAGVELALVERGPTGVFATAGVVGLALGLLWAINGATAPLTAGLVALGGAALLAIGFAARVAIVRVLGVEPPVLFVCRGAARSRAREAVEAVREARPGSARKPAATVVQFMLNELKALVAGEGKRRREYRLVAGEGANPEHEARFVQVRGRIAVFNLFWTLVVPLLGAGVAGALLAGRGGTEALLGAGGAFLALVFLGLKGLPRMQGLLARFVG